MFNVRIFYVYLKSSFMVFNYICTCVQRADDAAAAEGGGGGGVCGGGGAVCL